DKPVIRAVWPEEDFPDTPLPSGERGRPSSSPLPSGERGRGEGKEKRMRDLLGRFGLVGDQVYQPVGSLSGGERSRAALARLVALGVNLLVLDEPTNHLDIWACDALEQALLEFEGTVIVVSHDRYFLNRVVDLLIVLGDGRAQVIHGNYDTYERMRALQAEMQPSKREEKKESQRAAAAKPAKPKRRFPYRK